MSVLLLFDENKTLQTLREDSKGLIHYTGKMQAIKMLVQAYEIWDLNIKISEAYSDCPPPPYDKCSFTDIEKINRELLVYHISDFKPAKSLQSYCDRTLHFLKIVALGISNKSIS